jgi:soluble lytic murein transglycosylase-like protein
MSDAVPKALQGLAASNYLRASTFAGFVKTPEVKAKAKDIFKQVLPGVYKQYSDLIFDNAVAADVPPVLVWGIMQMESSGKADAVSPDGFDKGLMQINSRVWEAWYASLADPADWKKAELNVAQGVAILAGEYAAMRRMVVKGIALSGYALSRAAVAGYNAGTPAVQAALLAGNDPDSVTALGIMKRKKKTDRGYVERIFEAANDLNEKLAAYSNDLGTVDALAMIVLSSDTTPAVAAVAAEVRQEFVSLDRTTRMAQLDKKAAYAAAAAAHLAEGVKAGKAAFDADQANQLANVGLQPFVDDANFQSLSYSYVTGKWGAA